MRNVLFSLLGLLAIPANLMAFVGSVEVDPPRPTASEAITVRVAGDLPDPCWHLGESTVERHGLEVNVHIDMAHSADICPAVIVPYTLEVALGTLEPGTYQLTVADPQSSQSVTFEVTAAIAPILPVRFQRADANGDGKVDISDPIVILNALFLGTGTIGCQDAADVNDDGKVDMSDAVYGLNYLFIFDAEKKIPDPGPRACGLDPTEDALGCDDFAPCSPTTLGLYHVESSGVACLTWPCPVWEVTGEDLETLVSDLDISPLGLGPEAAGKLIEELAHGDWLVRGYFIPGPEGPAGLGTTLVIAELAGPAPR